MSYAQADKTAWQVLRLKLLKYLEVLKVSYLSRSAYIADLFSYGSLAAFRAWVYTQLYSKVFLARGVEVINGLDLKTTIWLLSMVQSFQVSSRTKKMMKNINDDIRNGDIAYSMVKPFNYMFFNISSNFGSILANISINILISVAAALILVGPIRVEISHLALGAVLLFFGYLINISAAFVLGITAFWTEDNSGTRWIYDKLLWIFGGAFLPVAFFPGWLRQIAELLPFTNIFYSPVKTALQFDLHLFWKYLAVQIFWLAFLLVSGQMLFNKARKNLSVNGG